MRHESQGLRLSRFHRNPDPPHWRPRRLGTPAEIPRCSPQAKRKRERPLATPVCFSTERLLHFTWARLSRRRSRHLRATRLHVVPAHLMPFFPALMFPPMLLMDELQLLPLILGQEAADPQQHARIGLLE